MRKSEQKRDPMVEHAEHLAEIIKGRKRFLNKPFSHWEQKTRELVVESLVRAAVNVDTRSIIGYMASLRLLELANQESPELTIKVLQQRDRWITNFSRVIKAIAP